MIAINSSTLFCFSLLYYFFISILEDYVRFLRTHFGRNNINKIPKIMVEILIKQF